MNGSGRNDFGWRVAIKNKIGKDKIIKGRISKNGIQTGRSGSHTSKSLKSSRYFFVFPGKRRREAFEIQDNGPAKTKTQNLASLQMASAAGGGLSGQKKIAVKSEIKQKMG